MARITSLEKILEEIRKKEIHWMDQAFKNIDENIASEFIGILKEPKKNISEVVTGKVTKNVLNKNIFEDPFPLINPANKKVKSVYPLLNRFYNEYMTPVLQFFTYKKTSKSTINYFIDYYKGIGELINMEEWYRMLLEYYYYLLFYSDNAYTFFKKYIESLNIPDLANYDIKELFEQFLEYIRKHDPYFLLASLIKSTPNVTISLETIQSAFRELIDQFLDFFRKKKYSPYNIINNVIEKLPNSTLRSLKKVGTLDPEQIWLEINKARIFRHFRMIEILLKNINKYLSKKQLKLIEKAFIREIKKHAFWVEGEPAEFENIISYINTLLAIESAGVMKYSLDFSTFIKDIFLWASQNADKLIVHSLCTTLIFLKFQDFIIKNLKNLYKNFLDILKELKNCEREDYNEYKNLIKNVFSDIKNILKVVINLTALMALSYTVGHMFEPFRVLFLRNEDGGLCTSKIYNLRFQICRKIMQLHLFIYKCINCVVNSVNSKKIKELKEISRVEDYNLMGPFSYIISIIAPWNVKNLSMPDFAKTNIQVYEELVAAEHEKSISKFIRRLIQKYSKVIPEKTQMDLKNRLKETAKIMAQDIIDTGLGLYGADYNSKLNK